MPAHPNKIEHLLDLLHVAVAEARVLRLDDPRWGVYWAETKRFADEIDSLVPAPCRPLTGAEDNLGPPLATVAMPKHRGSAGRVRS